MTYNCAWAFLGIGQTPAMAIRNTWKARKSGLKFEVMLLFIVWFFLGFNVKVKSLCWLLGYEIHCRMNLCQGEDYVPGPEGVSRVHGKKIFALSSTQDESVLRTSILTS
jgi:hypothetical protein